MTMPMSTAWLLNDIAEYKGKQELFSRQSPQILKALRDSATIQSAESSNRIEGVTVGHDRLHALVLGRATPRDRSEQEVQGYRRALNEIHASAATLGVTPDTLLHLHAQCQSSSAPKPSPTAPLLAQPRRTVRSLSDVPLTRQSDRLLTAMPGSSNVWTTTSWNSGPGTRR